MLILFIFSWIFLLQLVQITLLFYILYRLNQDKNAAVLFCKSVWFQLQNDFLSSGVLNVEPTNEPK